MEVDQEANEFGELYNTTKLNQPIKTINVRFFLIDSSGQMEACSVLLKTKGAC